VFNEKLLDAKGRELNVRTHSLEEIWNAPSMREIRQRMAEGKGLKGCEVCYHAERVSSHSYRTWANETFLEQLPTAAKTRQMIETAKGTDQIVKAKPQFFDVRLGNLCNLKCRSCNQTFSSQIEKDPVHSKYNRPLPIVQSRFLEEPWYESGQLRDELYGMSDEIMILTLAGGEPTINRLQMDWLQHLIDTGRAKDIICTVWTNFTSLNARFYDLIKYFKQFTLMMSIDGHGPVYEYLRFPGKWSVVEQNVQLLKSRVTNPSVIVTPVIQLCNAMTLVDIFDWAHEQGLGITLNRLAWPPYLHYNLLPPAARDVAVVRLEEYVSRSKAPAAFVADVKSLIGEFKELPAEPTAARRAQIAAFWKFTRDLDASRGQNFEATYPELAAYLNAFYGPVEAATG
jgi:MoaA/NifB/PqqE/SkfB family radical SAM enzyme